jgi:hypothetical protein
MRMSLSLAALCLFLAAPIAGAQGCFANVYGTSCGPKAKGSIKPQGQTQRIELTITDATPQNHVLMVIGTEKLNLPIAGTSCFINTNLVFFQLHMTDANGEYTFSKSIPRFSPGPPAYVQFYDLILDHPNGPTVRSTNGIEIGCN